MAAIAVPPYALSSEQREGLVSARSAPVAGVSEQQGPSRCSGLTVMSSPSIHWVRH